MATKRVVVKHYLVFYYFQFIFHSFNACDNSEIRVIMDPKIDQDQPQQPDQSNERRKSNRSPPYALFNLLVIVTAILYGAYHQMYLSKDATSDEAVEIITGEGDLQKIQLFTAEELKKFDGVSEYPRKIKLIFHVKLKHLRTSI